MSSLLVAMSISFAFAYPFLIFFFGVLSPGPANLAILQVALENGRKNAISFALGVVIGSVFWGVMTLLGLSQLIYQYPSSISILGFFGMLYMSWLGYTNIRKFFAFIALDNARANLSLTGRKNFFVRGLLIHLTNPKAFLVWTTILLSALDIEKGFILPPSFILFACALIAIFVFCGYAIFFSHEAFVTLYKRYSKYVHLAIGIVFFMVAVQLGLISVYGEI